MKRCICSLALVLCLLLSLGIGSEDSRASTVYFTAANDTLLDLSDATMPFWSSGTLYVPASAFGSGGLGISDSYNTAKKTLTLRRSGFRLICNLSSGMTVDSNGTMYEFTPLERGGMVFLPINEVCRIFSLSCTTRSVPNGYLVRIRNESASFTDDAFISAASAMLSSRYQEYMASHRQDNPTPDPENTEGRSLYLGFTVRSAAQAHGWLTVCGSTAHHATFFLTEEFLRDPDCPDAVRRILAEGHTLGLAVSEDSGDRALELLQEGNDALDEIACTRTRLALADSAAEKTFSDAGYCPVSFDLSLAGKTELTTSEILQLLNRAGSSARLDLGSDLSEASLRSLLRSAQSQGFLGQNFRESSH